MKIGGKLRLVSMSSRRRHRKWHLWTIML